MPSLSFDSKSTRLPHVIMVFFIIDIGLCIAYIINYLIGSPFWKLTKILDLDGENSLPNWYSSMQLFCIFILSSIFVYRNFSKESKSILLIFLPIIFLLMSIDESVQIHEWLGHKSDILLPSGSRIGTHFSETGIWMFVIGLPFLALFLLWAYSIKQIIFDNLANLRKIVLGMCILLFGALGVEILSNFAENSLYVTQVVFEEGLEMIGATFILWATYNMALEYISSMNQKNI